MSLAGKVALVTGGARGIGAATAALLAKRGAAVAVNYVAHPAQAEDVVRSIAAAGGTAWAIRADVREAEEVRRMTDEVMQRCGRLDLLVNNAGMPFVRKSLEQMTWEEFAQKLNDELRTAFLVTKAAVGCMKRHGYGRIVFVASGLARRPAPAMAAHGTAKAALVQFARYVAQEYGPAGITANVVSPGLVQTDATAFVPPDNLQRVAALTPLGRTAKGGYEATSALLGAVRPDGLICLSDQVAVGALSALHDAGVPVPDACEVMGFGDAEVSRFTIPKLSTMNLPVQAMAQRAAQFLLQQILGRSKTPQRETFPIRIVHRETTLSSTGR